VTLTEEDPGLLSAQTPDPTREGLLTRIDRYYDLAPRATSRAEEHGSLVLFVAEQGWPFYARPRLGRDTEPTTDEIHTILARQIELGEPRALEWIHETAPSLADRARAAGMTVHECPLLMLGPLAEPDPGNGEVRLLEADDDELGNLNAAIDVAFGMPGTAVGEAGVAERDDALNSPDAAQRLGFTTDALRSGRTVCAGAFVDGAGAVGGGSHNPRGAITEIVGVGLLPAFRRQGLAGAIAHLLARDALDNGVTTVFCGAESSEVARVYERVGFHRIGTSCVAEMD
jgi:GNAT superfamily N-acetyltransferase